jgi:hypothetical protein
VLADITSPSNGKLIYRDGYFYIFSLDALQIFDEAGRWIRTINRKGQGAEEYLSLYSFDVNHYKEIAILDNGTKKIFFYTWEGEFSASANCPSDMDRLLSINYMNDRQLVMSAHPGKSEGDSKYHILDRHTLEFVNSYWPSYIRPALSFLLSNPVVDFQGKSLFFQPQNPNIYEMTADSAILRYSIDVDGKIPPVDYWEVKGMTWAEITEQNIFLRLIQEYREKGYIGHIMFFSEALESILLQFSDGKATFDGTYALINKEDRSSILMDKIAFDNHLIWKPRKMFSRSDGIVIIPIPAHTLLESGDGEIRKMFPNLSEEDNPILCIGKLR